MATAAEFLDATDAPSQPDLSATGFLDSPNSDEATALKSNIGLATAGEQAKKLQTQSFEDYLDENPTPSTIEARKLLPLADTPEKQQRLAEYIKATKSPELESPETAGQIGQAITTGPIPEGEHLLQAAPTSTPGKAALGVERSAEDLGNFFLSPAGIATIGIGALPKAAQRVAALAFAGQMASQVPGDTVQLLQEVSKDPKDRDWTKIAQLLTSDTANTILASIGAAHGVAPSRAINVRPFFETKQDKLSKALASELGKSEPQIQGSFEAAPLVREAGEKPPAPGVTADQFLDQNENKTQAEGKPTMGSSEEQAAPGPAVGVSEPLPGDQGRPAAEKIQLKPALLVNDNPVTGGETHRAIFYKVLGDKEATKTEKSDAAEALLNDDQHVFVDQNGKVYNRQEAAKVFDESRGNPPGTTTALHSEMLSRGEPVPAPPKLDVPNVVKSVSTMPSDDFISFTKKEKGGLTGSAYRLGQSISTPEELQSLQDQQDKFSKLANAAREKKDFNAGFDAAMRKQFFREAYEAATGTGSAGDSLRGSDPNYKPPFPMAEKPEEAPPIVPQPEKVPAAKKTKVKAAATPTAPAERPIPTYEEAKKQNLPRAVVGPIGEYESIQKILTTGINADGSKLSKKHRQELIDRIPQVVENFKAKSVQAAPKLEAEKPVEAVAKVKDHIKDVAATSGQRPAKEVKAELVSRVESAIKDVPEPTKEQKDALDTPQPKMSTFRDFLPEEGKRTKEVEAEAMRKSSAENERRRVEWMDNVKKTGLKQVTIDIPGDGTFTVWNTKEALGEVLTRAKKLETHPVEPDVTAFKKVRPTGNIPPEIWVTSSEPTHTVTIHTIEGSKNGEAQRPGKPVEVKSFPGKTLYLTSDGKEFVITEPETGLRVGGGKTIQDAMKDAEGAPARLREKGVDKSIDDIIAANVANLGRRPAPVPIKREAEGINKGALGKSGMGGAKPSEFPNTQQSPTSIKNATVDQERAKRGLPSAIQPAKRAFEQVWDQAMATIDQDPGVQDRLIEELSAKPRAVTDLEDALLLHRQIELQNEYGKNTQELSHAYDDAKQFPNRMDDVAELKNRVAGLADRLYELYEVNKRVGTETGRGLNARKMMAYEDYSLAQMELDKRAANGGKPLTDDQRAEVQKLHDKIAKLRKDYDDFVEASNRRISELEAEKQLDKISQEETPVEPHVKSIADRIVAGLDAQATAARERIKARSGRLRTGIDPTELADYAIIGASHIGKGIVKFSDWSAAMLGEFGDALKPHLKQIFDKANKNVDDAVARASSPQTAPKVKRAVKQKTIPQQQESLKTRISERLAEGKKDEITGLVRRLARTFVADGVKNRDELIDAVHSVLESIDPSITRRETMDAISGYGDFKQLSKDAISRELRDLKGQMQQVAKLEDMQAGQPPLKTGIERRTPSREESLLIKQVNEAKRKFQIPITDPNTQLKSALDTLKARMRTRTEELQRRLAEGDFAPRPQPESLKLDDQARTLKAEYERARLEYERGLLDDRLKNRTPLEKLADTFVKWRRGFLLSSPITLGKLTSAALQRMTFTPAEEAIGAGLSRVFPSVARRAAREGGFNAKAEAKAITEAVTKGMKDSWDMMTKGSTELDALYGGGREGYVRESLNLPRSFIDFFGQVHGALKAPTKRAEFARSYEKRTAAAIRDGVDVSDPMVQTRLAVESYKDANRAIFLQDNRLVTAYKMFLAGLETKNKETGKPTIGGKLGATAARIALPIVRVPANIVAETFQYAFGSITGAARLGVAMSRGFENLKPNEADLILREMKKGSLGAAVMLIGYFNADNIGGYYEPGQKRKPGDVKVGGVRLPFSNPITGTLHFLHLIPQDSQEIPNWLLHNPLLETLQLGATIRRVADSKLRAKDQQTRGKMAGLMAGALGLADEVPFVREMFGEVPKMFNPNEQGAFWGELGKSLVVPQLLQFIAGQMDKDEKGNVVPRKPETTFQHIETGLPFLRQNVPLKNQPTKSVLTE